MSEDSEREYPPGTVEGSSSDPEEVDDTRGSERKPKMIGVLRNHGGEHRRSTDNGIGESPDRGRLEQDIKPESKIEDPDLITKEMPDYLRPDNK